jgi:hypothetical protein
LTAERHPRTIFRRAIERGNLVVAEITAREMGRLSLEEALYLTRLWHSRIRGAAPAMQFDGLPGSSVSSTLR